jgi:ABC-type multidrug transport system fused ATPase/permease subunit
MYVCVCVPPCSYLVGSKIALMYGAFNGIIGFVPQGAIAMVLWYGGKLVIDGELSTGTLTSFLLYTLSVAVVRGPGPLHRPTHPPTHPHRHPPTHPHTHTRTHTHKQTNKHTHTRQNDDVHESIGASLSAHVHTYTPHTHSPLPHTHTDRRYTRRGGGQALAFISSLFGDFMAAVGATERIFVLLDRRPEIQTKGCGSAPQPHLSPLPHSFVPMCATVAMWCGPWASVRMCVCA